MLHYREVITLSDFITFSMDKCTFLLHYWGYNIIGNLLHDQVLQGGLSAFSELLPDTSHEGMFLSTTAVQTPSPLPGC